MWRSASLTGLLALLAFAVAAAAEPELDVAQRAAALVRQLGAEEFAAREEAEKALQTLGPGAFPHVKAALAVCEDPDARLRLQRVRRALALEAETDPEALAVCGREEALARRFPEATRFFARAAALFRERAHGAKDDQERQRLAAAAERAEVRRGWASRWAEALGNSDQVRISGPRVFIAVQQIRGNIHFNSWQELPPANPADW